MKRHARRLLAMVSLLGLLGSAGAARADEPVTPPVELRHDLRVDLPVTAGLAVATVGFRLVRDDLEPSTFRWCDGSKPGSVNAVDDWFRTALRRQDTGTVVGGGVPLLFHPLRPGESVSWLRRARIVATPLPQGQMLGFAWLL